MFQVPFAEAIRNTKAMATMTVGAITEPSQINTILHTRRADLVALGRPHLWNPYFTRQAEAWYGARNQPWPEPYWAGRNQAHGELAKARERQILLQKKARPAKHATAEVSGLNPRRPRP
jgi:anthraniloyl-CoA monooxygenase